MGQKYRNIAAKLQQTCSKHEPFCCVLRQFGPVLLCSALIWSRFAVFCINLKAPERPRTPQNAQERTRTPQNAQKRTRTHPQINTECSKTAPKSLQNIAKRPPKRCRIQKNDPQINAEYRKTTSKTMSSFSRA